MSFPLIIDSFAGGGGASTGIEMALGRSPDIAIYHNAAALALHEANHPQTLHLSENVYKIEPLDYLRDAHVGLDWFSPVINGEVFSKSVQVSCCNSVSPPVAAALVGANCGHLALQREAAE